MIYFFILELGSTSGIFLKHLKRPLQIIVLDFYLKVGSMGSKILLYRSNTWVYKGFELTIFRLFGRTKRRAVFIHFGSSGQSRALCISSCVLVMVVSLELYYLMLIDVY